MDNVEDFTVENINLDLNNQEFITALNLVEHTNQIFYLTGKAGTGKTTFLKYLKKKTKKNMAVVAPTGVAAINAKGVTLHSFFKIPFSPFTPVDQRLQRQSVVLNPNTGEKSPNIYDTFQYNRERLKIVRELQLLVVDEVSIVRCDLLDVIDQILRTFRGKFYEPFGGVQVLLIGDTFQLPPVVMNNEWRILSRFYQTPFFFSAKVIQTAISQSLFGHIELKKIYRQKEEKFIALLNRVRVNQLEQNDFKILDSIHNPIFAPKDNENYVYLASHNEIVKRTNLTRLNLLKGELFEFQANITGDFPENKKPTDTIIKLKEGAQIMFIKNDSAETKRYYNGKIARVVSVSEEEIVAEFEDNSQITVERTEWENIEYRWNAEEEKIEEVTLGTFEQFPIKLAWVITVHKSQGLTFEKVYADLANCFASGQVYVALSRCTSFNGLVLKTKIPPKAIITDPRVLEFAKTKTPNTLIDGFLNSGLADEKYKEAREAFKNKDFELALANLKEAFELRNDIDTDIFKRYLTAHLNRLVNSSTQKDVKKINELKLELSMLTLAQLVDEEEINSQKRTNRELSQEIEVLNAKIKSLEGTSSKLLEQLESKNIEINELKNLKWYQRIKR